MVAVLLTALTASPGAQAQAGSAASIAELHWKQGLAHRDAKLHLAAIGEFKKSIDAFPTTAAYNDLGEACAANHLMRG